MENDMIVGLPKVVLMGLRKSGKSSIRKVVFEKVAPQDTIFLPTTVKVETDDIDTNTFVKFQVCDFPGQLNPFDTQNRGYFDPKKIFQNCGAIVFVMDCDQYVDESERRLLDTILAAYEFNATCCIEVFIHKVDSLEVSAQKEIHSKVRRFLDEGMNSIIEKRDVSKIKVNFNFTTIYDHSVFTAFSAVVQNLISKQGPYISELMTMLSNRSCFEYAFLLDSTSKIFLSKTDVHTNKYVLVRDAVELLENLSDVYNSKGPTSSSSSPAQQQQQLQSLGNTYNSAEGGGSSSANGTTAASILAQAAESMNNTATANGVTSSSTALTTVDTVIRLANNDVLYVRHLGSNLALAAVIREHNFKNRAMIDYNIAIFGRAVTEIFEAAEKRGGK